MGLAPSKVCKQVPQEDLQEASIPSTPLFTRKVIKSEELDPRSPSVNISRTPMQLVSAVPLKVGEGKESDLVAEQTPAKAETILLGIDPRSPTTEFNRTPIIVSASEVDASAKLCNKTLDRVKRSVITTPKAYEKRAYEKVVTNPKPKLLESSPIREKTNINKRKSFVGLLETNIDFTETDLDAVIREKSKVELQGGTSSDPEQIFNVVQLENIDPRSPTTDFLRTPIQIIKKISDLNLDKENYEDENKLEVAELQDHTIIEKCVKEICEIVHSNPEIETMVKQTLFQSNDLLDEDASSLCQDHFNNKTEDDDDEDGMVAAGVEVKSAPITPPAIDASAIPMILKEVKSAPTSPSLSLRSGVKELDKKLTSLIYQDEDIVICPRKVKLKDYDSRSPLRSLNVIDTEKKKSAQKTKVGDKARKSDYAVSKIPVYREKSRRTEVQCENTPPRNMERRKAKVRKSQWDNADATLII
ncbi:hypothetical protein NQ315_015722 [Exocentrus adspersus]|uniref:Uncharacterized protein n=1 Tax=Exocentrus adspersus TaxID=1586481 RepID=A0AAV8W375_9CUCU|nr:hypothetical protein NQ315_015722 [Exocentrus adspersus]